MPSATMTAPIAASGDATSSTAVRDDDRDAEAEHGQDRAGLRRPQNPADRRRQRPRRVER